MNIDEFEILMGKCRITVDQDHLVFIPFSDKDEKLIHQIVKDNQLEKLSSEDFQNLAKQYLPSYQARLKLKQQKTEQFSALTTQQVADLPLEQKLDYLEALFPANQTEAELLDICKKNEANIKACLLNITFPKSFWNSEKKSADRFVALIAHQPDIMEKVKNWENTTLEEEKLVVQQAGQIFKHVYGVSPEIVFFTPEEEKARRRAQGLNEDVHINAAYFFRGKLHFNEERLQNSDNFFAISVLFHEGTHMRQHYTSFGDTSVDRLFACYVTNINLYEDELSDRGSSAYKDLYTMQPSEVHAHGLQQYVEQQITEKTGIEKTQFADLDKETEQIHNKAFSMAALSQYRSSQK